MIALSLWVSTDATGRNYDLATEIRHRAQLLLSERPELGPCLRAATNEVALDPRFDLIWFETPVALHARVTESDRNGHLERSTKVIGRARVREGHWFMDSYRDVYAICEQRDEAPASAKLELIKE